MPRKKAIPAAANIPTDDESYAARDEFGGGLNDDIAAAEEQQKEEEATAEAADTRTAEEKAADRMADRIAQGISRGFGPVLTQMQANQPVQKVPIGRYDPKTPWQKGKSKKQMPTLLGMAFENGARIDPSKLTAEAINALNAIHTSGRYVDRLVEVVVRMETDGKFIDIRYNSKRDDLMELKGHVRSFDEIVQRVVEEQPEEAPALV